MPTPKQMEKMAAAVGREPHRTPNPGPADPMPAEYWESILRDPLADASPMLRSASTKAKQLSKISLHVLRVACSRCGRTVEIQRLDAIRLYGPDAAWKDVGQRLLDNTCQQRTGRHEEDGCWPDYDAP
jgi:hypothetical protein